MVVEDMGVVFWEAKQVVELGFLEQAMGQDQEEEEDDIQEVEEDFNQEEEEDFKQEGLEAHRPESLHPLAGEYSKYANMNQMSNEICGS